MRLLIVFLALLGIALRSGARDQETLPDGIYAEFVTPRGMVVAELFYRQTPLTVANLVGLAEGTLGPKPGAPFFDGLKFHRVVPNFVVQGGDPLGTGEGGPGYSFPDEFVPGLRHDSAGILSMANDGPDTNGSQFFFTLRPVNRLNYLHSVFGRVVRGIEVLPLIRADDVMQSVRIRRIGADAKAFHPDAAAFAAMAARTKKFQAAPAPGPREYFDDPEHLLPSEHPRALAFQRKLANFERATGRKIYARIAAKYQPDSPTQKPGSVVAALAKKIGLGSDAILAVYYANINQFVLWVGDDRLQQFTGKSGDDLREFVRAGGLHGTKQAFLAKARAKADAAIAEAIQTAPATEPIESAQKLKLQVDAVLDDLIFKFEPSGKS